MITRSLVVAGLAAAFGTSASAAVIASISTDQGSLNTGSGVTDRYDASAVDITLDPNVSGPTAADLISNGNDGNGIVGMSRIWNNAAGGFFSLNAGGTGTSVGDFGTGFFAFTIEADPDFVLNLTGFSVDSAVFTSDNRRGFEIYAEVDGGSFDVSDLLVDINDENTERPSVRNNVVNLSGAKYQGISSIEIRVYPLADGSGRTVDFANFQISGTVVPEPASLALVALGSVCVLSRRRGQA